jgi:sugar phosphate isomerase/epimerase
MKIDALSRKVSITTDMFNSSLGLGIERKLRLFAESGFEYIHWCDDWNNDVLYAKEDIELYHRLVESYGLKCIDVHGADTGTIHIASEEEVALDEYIQLLKTRIEFCSAVGGDAVVIHPPTDDGGSRTLSWKLDRSLRVFESVRPLCEDLDVVLAVENCHPSDEKVLRYYFERYPPEFVGFCFDSGHAHLNKNLDELLKFGDRLRALHLHDNRGMEDDHQPPFWGTIDWERVTRWIERSEYQKPLNFEILHDPRFFEGTPEGFLDYTVRSIRKILALISS